MSKQFIEINNWTGGINDNQDPQTIKDNELQFVRNFHLDKTGALVSRKGQSIVTVTAQSGTVTSIFGATVSTGSSPCIVTIYDSTSSEGLFFQLNSANIWSSIGKGAGVTGPGSSLFKWVMFNDLMIGVGDYSAASSGWPCISWNGVDTSASVLTGVASANITIPSDIAIWNRRVCLSQGTDLYISDAGIATAWLGGDSQVFRFRGSSFDEEAITAIYPFQGKLIVFKSSSIWEVDPGNGLAESFEIRQIGFNIGCNSRHSIADIGRDLIFANQAGLNSLQDIRDKGGLAISGRVSQNIYQSIWSTININKLDKIVSVFNTELEEYMISVPSGNSTRNDLVIVLNTQFSNKNQSPSIWPYVYGKQISCFARRPGIPKTKIDIGSYEGIVYRCNDDELDAGLLYSRTLTTKEWNFNSPLENKVFFDITVQAAQSNQFNINIVANFNNESRSKPYSINLYGAVARWDESYWDGSYWASLKAGIKKKYFSYVARNCSLTIADSPTLVSDAGELTLFKIIFDVEKVTEDFTVT